MQILKYLLAHVVKVVQVHHLSMLRLLVLLNVEIQQALVTASA